MRNKEKLRFRDVFNKKYLYVIWAVFFAIYYLNLFLLEVDNFIMPLVISFIYAFAYSLLIQNIQKNYLSIFKNLGFWIASLFPILGSLIVRDFLFIDIIISFGSVFVVASLIWGIKRLVLKNQKTK